MILFGGFFMQCWWGVGFAKRDVLACTTRSDEVNCFVSKKAL
jgi:hypothetical protein